MTEASQGQAQPPEPQQRQVPEKLDDVAIEEACARHAHETNEAFLSAMGLDTTPWRWLQEPDKGRLRAMVDAILNLGLTAEEKHEQWCQGMRAKGWSYGPNKSEEFKHHPMLKPWEELPQAQRAKDFLVVASVNAMAMALGHSKRPFDTKEVRFGER